MKFLRYSHPMPIPINNPLHPPSNVLIPRPWRPAGEQRLAAVAMLQISLTNPGLEQVPVAQDTDGILLIKRSENLRGHSGQWALPGGKQEPNESLWQTAKRELHEETRLSPERIHWTGDMGGLVTGTGYRAQVLLGRMTQPEAIQVDGSEAVLASAYPIQWLLREDTYRSRPVGVIHGRHFSWGHPDPAQDWPTPLCGATAFMLLELRRRLRPDLPDPDTRPKD